MSEKNEFSMLDAFMALNQLDDDSVSDMIKPRAKTSRSKSLGRKALREGRSYPLNSADSTLESAKAFLKENDDIQLEVIDPDADSLEHVKDKIEYVGQMILRCKRCQANKFIEMDKLVEDPETEDVYNREDECPNCKTSGAGFEILGQVGKFETDEVEEPASDDEDAAASVESEEDAEDANTEEEEPAIENDEVNADELKFDNDIEIEEEPAAESEPEDTSDEVTVTSDDEEEESEPDMMETSTSEDDDLDIDALLASLGDEADPDDDLEVDDDEKVKEALNEDAVVLGPAFEEVQLMDELIDCLANKDAYFLNWIHVLPECSDAELEMQLRDKNTYDYIKNEFLDIYKRYRGDGFVNAPKHVLDYAHQLDAQNNFAFAENRNQYARESYSNRKHATVTQLLEAVMDSDNLSEVEITNDLGRATKTIYRGSYSTLPADIANATCKSFNTANQILSCNIDPKSCSGLLLSDILDKFDDSDAENIYLYDIGTSDELYSGKKRGALSEYGKCSLISIDTPSIVRLTIADPSVKLTEKRSLIRKSLVDKILEANQLSKYRINKPLSQEYWINESINHREDLDTIYELYVKNTNQALITEFKAATGYSVPLDEAFEAGYAAALEELKSSGALNEDVDMSAMKYAVIKPNGEYAGVPCESAEEAREVAVQEEGRAVFKLSRVAHFGESYDEEGNPEKCDKCGTLLNDMGTCPKCDDGEEDYGDDDDTNEALNESKCSKYVSKECSDDVAEEIALMAMRAMKLREHEAEALEYDLKDGLAINWVDDFAALPDTSDVKKLFFTFAVSCVENEALTEAATSSVDPELAAAISDSITAMLTEYDLDPSDDEFTNQVFADVEQNSNIDIPQDKAAYNAWMSDIYDEIDRQLREQSSTKALTESLDVNQYTNTALVNGNIVKAYTISLKHPAGDQIVDVKLLKSGDKFFPVIESHDGDIDIHTLNDYIDQCSREYRAAANTQQEGEDALEDIVIELLDAPEDAIRLMNEAVVGSGAKMTADKLSELVTKEMPKATKECGTNLKGLQAYFDGIIPELGDGSYDQKDLKAAIIKELEKTSDIAESIISCVDRKQVSEVITECKNNSKPYTVRRSTKPGFRYDVITERNDALVARHNADMDVALTPEEREVNQIIARVAKDISDAIYNRYQVEADPALIVADILQDLALISGDLRVEDLPDTYANRITADMYRSYTEVEALIDTIMSVMTGQNIQSTPEQKIRRAVAALKSPAFSTENIIAGVNSPQFHRLAVAGNVPFLPASSALMLEDCSEEDCIDRSKFDADINEYFKEAYEECVRYTTERCSINANGDILMEGFLDSESCSTNVTFTLKPSKPITESFSSKSDQRAFFESLSYIVTNNLSDEVFELTFD